MNEQNILILESDHRFAADLVKTLEKIGSYHVSIVPNTREACLSLVQSRQDLVFIPVDEGAKIIRSLRAIQPDLRLILMTPTPDIDIPITYSGRVQGVLIKDQLEMELPSILVDAFSQPFFIRDLTEVNPTTGRYPIDTAVLVSTLQQATLGTLIQTVIFSHGNKLLAYWGDLNEREAATVALHVGREWPEDPQLTRVQFLHLPARAGDILLYSAPVRDDYLLTLVALPETPISECRREVENLIPSLNDILAGKMNEATNALSYPTSGNHTHDRVSYVIVWRPIEPLADSLFTPLRQALLRLATTNGCVLTHLRVESNLIHIVVTCPPGKEAAWAAYLFKSGSEQIIQQEYGVLNNMWEMGFYATESATPLNKAELELFLSHSPSSS